MNVEQVIREAVGAKRDDATVVAVCRVVGERDELRRLLQSGGLHDAEVRAALSAHDGETTADAARRAHGEIMNAEGRTDAILDSLSAALGVEASSEALLKGAAEVSEALRRIRAVTGGFAPRHVADYAIERLVDFDAMRLDRNEYQRTVERHGEVLDVVWRVTELLELSDDPACAAAARMIRDAQETEIPF